MNDKQKELIKQIREQREQRKQVRKKKIEEDVRKHNERKEHKLADKKENKAFYQEAKQKVKELKKEKSLALKELKKQGLDKQALKTAREEIKEEYNEKIIMIKNEVLDRKFDFGKKYNTLSWRLLKWVYGVRKEFNRIIWSSPTNTFKYLAIIVVIVLFLSAIFIGIDAIVNTFIH